MHYTPTTDSRANRPAARRALIPALALLLTHAGSSLFAQTTPPAKPTAASTDEEVVRLNAIVSTGSRFNDRTVADSPVPIDVLSQTDLNQGGYTETAQMLQALVPSFNFPRPSLTDGTDHIRPATLRGLAPDQTLLLVNGKRRHTSALVNLNGSIGKGSVSTDFNAIPSSAIEHVEVLRDGASAQYGSDAIAGVINVILRKNTGWGLDASWGATKEGDGRDLKVDAFAGVPLGEKGTLFVTTYARNKSPTSRIEADTRQQYFGANSATGVATAISGNYQSGGTLPPAGTNLDLREKTVNRFNHRFGDPRVKDKGFMYNAELPAGEFTFYTFGQLNDRHAEGAGFFRRAGDDRTIRSIWPNGFLPVIQTDVIDYALGAGVKGKVADWQWDFSLVNGANELGYTTAQSINDSLGAASPTSFYDGKLIFNQWTANLDGTNEYKVGLKNPLKVALGAEYRYEQYKIGAGEPGSYIDGGQKILDGPAAGTQGGSTPGAQVFPGFKPSDAGRHTRDVKAAYVDFENEVSESLLVSLAGRFEHYSDFGENTTGKIAGRYKLTPEFSLRGSISTGFRAPHLAQEWFSSTATNNIAGVGLVEVRTFPVTDPIAQALGASKLQPEKSMNYSGGFSWQPLTNLTATVDYYDITIHDRIVLSSTYTGAAVTTFLTSRGLPAVGGGRYFTNGVNTDTEGADFNVRYSFKLNNAGKVTLTTGANVNRTRITKYKPTPPQLAALGITTPLFDLSEQIRMSKGQPRNNVNIAVGYDLKDWSFLVRNIRYGDVSAVALTSSTPAAQAALLNGYDVSLAPTVPAGANSQVIQKFGAKWLTDIDVTYRWGKHVTFSVGANNVFDIYPDQNIRSVVSGGTAFSGNDNVGIFPYNSVSPFGFSGAFYYTKASYKF